MRFMCLVRYCDHISKDIKEKYTCIDTIVTIDSVRYCSIVHYCSTTIVGIGTITHVTVSCSVIVTSSGYLLFKKT